MAAKYAYFRMQGKFFSIISEGISEINRGRLNRERIAALGDQLKASWFFHKVQSLLDIQQKPNSVDFFSF